MAAGLLILWAVVGVVTGCHGPQKLFGWFGGNGPWAINGGWEYTVVLATPGASIALTGPGEASVDHPVGLDWSTARNVGGVAAALAMLLLGRSMSAQPVATGGEGEPRWTTA